MRWFFPVYSIVSNLRSSLLSPVEPLATFRCPDPVPMNFESIDLSPFEDASRPWTEEYSHSLQLQFHPRRYQIEVIRDAIRSRNSVVCLRTGSGKTFIASIVIKYYFIKKQQAHPGSSFFSLFFVPRKAIRLQQANAIVAVGNLKVQICEDDQTIDRVIHSNHVVVATPQKFVNGLKKRTVVLSKIDLMIFDECHNTSGGNPYCEIMKFYLCPSRRETPVSESTPQPCIIGLTASISAKDAHEKRDSIEKNLVSLCSKLACRNISTICDEQNLEEINREISRPGNDQFEFVRKAEFNDSFHEYLHIVENLIEQIKKHLNDKETILDQTVGSSGFIGQLVLVKQSFERNGEMTHIIICDYLLLLTKKHSALRDLPIDLLVREMIASIDQYHNGYEQPVSIENLIYDFCHSELTSILDKHGEHPATNSKLDHLVSLLKRHAQNGAKGKHTC